MHTSTLRAAGGSIAVTIPQALAKLLGLRAGDAVNIEADGGRLVVAPQNRKRYSVDDLLAMQGSQPLEIDHAWDAMPTAGREVEL